MITPAATAGEERGLLSITTTRLDPEARHAVRIQLTLSLVKARPIYLHTYCVLHCHSYMSGLIAVSRVNTTVTSPMTAAAMT